MAELSPDIDPLEAQCLYVLWLRHQADESSSDDLVSAEQVAADLQMLRGGEIRVTRVLNKLNQLEQRGFVTASFINREDGTAGRRLRGFRIASSDRIVKWPATGAVLHFLLHHDLLPVPYSSFTEEALAKNFQDHKTKTQLTKSDLDRQIDYSVNRGYIIRERDNGDTLNVGDRTRWEVHYLRLLGLHAVPGTDLSTILRKPPGVSDQSAQVKRKNPASDEGADDNAASDKKAI